MLRIWQFFLEPLETRSAPALTRATYFHYGHANLHKPGTQKDPPPLWYLEPNLVTNI